jgi:nitroreductase
VKTLLSRASSGALGDPGPDDIALRKIFEAAVRAPDHGRLRPWHFYVIRGDARVKLSEMFAEALKRREPEASASAIEKERGKPLRSPVIIAAVAKILEGHKIPPFEQTLSAAAAVMNILNAAHALGFGAKWITGANCYDAEFRTAFGLRESDQLIGFIHLGTPLEEAAAVRPDPGEFFSEWG